MPSGTVLVLNDAEYGACASVAIGVQVLRLAGEYSKVTDAIVRPEDGVATALRVIGPRMHSVPQPAVPTGASILTAGAVGDWASAPPPVPTDSASTTIAPAPTVARTIPRTRLTAAIPGAEAVPRSRSGSSACRSAARSATGSARSPR